MRYLIEISKQNGSYQGTRYEEHRPANRHTLIDPKLDKDDVISLNGNTWKLGALVDDLIKYNQQTLKKFFNERGQLQLGQYLYAQVFGDTKPQDVRNGNETNIEIRIVTTDEDLRRLPWVLLAHEGHFLSALGWSVTLSLKSDSTDCELPPSPRVLIVAPQPKEGFTDTKPKDHLEAIEEMLTASSPRYFSGNDLRLVDNWEDFCSAVSDFKPHVVYYYGHGIGNMHQSRLVFVSKATGLRSDKSIIDLADCLRAQPGGPPVVVYLNCCGGDAGGHLGAGGQLSELIPAVVTNFTAAHISAAQEQGRAFLRSIILSDTPPHAAIAELRSNITSKNLSFSDVRWMAPVLYCSYKTWRSNPPQNDFFGWRDPHWQYRLDRVVQFGRVFLEVTDMTVSQSPRSLVYAWYGQQGQGVEESFHNRINVELKEKFKKNFQEYRPKWPDHSADPSDSFASMYRSIFEVNRLEEIPARIRDRARDLSGGKIIAYVRHPALSAQNIMTPARLQEYLEWWDFNIASLLGSQIIMVLGLPFVVRYPDAFKVAVAQEVIAQLALQKTSFRLLEEMKAVDRQDVLDFLEMHNVYLPKKRRIPMLDGIIARTEGRYEATIDELKDIEAKTWKYNLQVDAEDSTSAADFF